MTESKRCTTEIESNRSSDADKGARLAFSDEMAFLDMWYTNYRHLTLLAHCTIVAGDATKDAPAERRDCELVDAREDGATVTEIERWIKRTFDNEEESEYRKMVLLGAGSQ